VSRRDSVADVDDFSSPFRPSVPLDSANPLVANGFRRAHCRKYGDAVINYKNPQTKHLIGLLLFSGIASLLVALGSPFLPLFFLAFLVFAMAVIDIVGEYFLRHSELLSIAPH